VNDFSHRRVPGPSASEARPPAGAAHRKPAAKRVFFAAALILLAGVVLTGPSGAAAPAEPDPLVAEALSTGRPVLGEFVSETCPACDQLRPALEEVLSRYPHIVHQVHDADKEPELAKKYEVKCVPVIVIIGPDGQVRFNQVGFWTVEELEQVLRDAGVTEAPQ